MRAMQTSGHPVSGTTLQGSPAPTHASQVAVTFSPGEVALSRQEPSVPSPPLPPLPALPHPSP